MPNEREHVADLEVSVGTGRHWVCLGTAVVLAVTSLSVVSPFDFSGQTLPIGGLCLVAPERCSVREAETDVREPSSSGGNADGLASLRGVTLSASSEFSTTVRKNLGSAGTTSARVETTTTAALAPVETSAVPDTSTATTTASNPTAAPYLDIFHPACGDCFRAAASRVHRSVVAVGVHVAPASLHDYEYFALYISFQDHVAASLFNSGRPSIILGNCTQLPFSDLVLDTVILNATVQCGGGVLEDWALTLSEATRVLRPGGVLLLGDAVRELPVLGSAEVGVAGALLQATGYQNLFRRRPSMALDVVVCEGCRMHSPFGQDYSSHPSGVPTKLDCQPYIHPDYRPLDNDVGQQGVLRESSLSLGRLKWWPVENVLHTQYNRSSWTDRVHKQENGWFIDNYVGKTMADGSRGDPHKAEWYFSDLIRSGRVRRLLDAGAGSCSLDGVLRQQGLAKMLQPYVAFGAYDCSMLRICGERGAISFQWNWFNPIPVCKECTFDLVFQAEGMHHVQAENFELTFDNFDAHLACNGLLVMSDHPCDRPGVPCWRDAAKAWAQNRGYHFQYHRNYLEVRIEKRCPDPGP